MPNSLSVEKKNLLKNVSWLFGSRIGGSLFVALEAVLLARFLGLEQFGLFSLIVAYVGIVNSFFDLRVKEATVKYVGQQMERHEKKKLVSFIRLFYLIDFSTGLMAFFVAIAFAGLADTLFIKSEGVFEFVLIYSFCLLVSTVNASSRAILEVFKKFGSVGLVDMFSVAARVLFVLVFLMAGFGIKGVLLAYVVGAFINFSVLQFLVNSVLTREGFGGWFRGSFKLGKSEIKNVMSFIFSSTLSAFFGRVFREDFPILLLGHFFGKETSGLYKIAIAFPKVIVKLRSPLGRVIYPSLVSLEERGSYDDFEKIISYSVSFLLKFFIPIGTVFFIFADEIIALTFGAEYIPAATAMRIIVVGEVLYGFFFWTTAVFLVLGRIWFRTGLTFINSICYLVACFYLVPFYSVEGAAFAKLVPHVISLSVAVLLFREIRGRRGERRI